MKPNSESGQPGNTGRRSGCGFWRKAPQGTAPALVTVSVIAALVLLVFFRLLSPQARGLLLEVPLFTSSTMMLHCSASPDGECVATLPIPSPFRLGGEGPGAIWFVDTKTWKLTREITVKWAHRFCGWSTDGSKLLADCGPAPPVGDSPTKGYCWVNLKDGKLVDIPQPKGYYVCNMWPAGDGRYILEASRPGDAATTAGERFPLYLWVPTRRALTALAPGRAEGPAGAGFFGLCPRPGNGNPNRAYWHGWSSIQSLRGSERLDSLWQTNLDTGISTQVLPPEAGWPCWSLSRDCTLLARASTKGPDGRARVEVRNLESKKAVEFNIGASPDRLVWSAGNRYLLGTGCTVWVYDVTTGALRDHLRGIGKSTAVVGYRHAADCLATEGEFVLVCDSTIQVVDGKTGQVHTVCTVQSLEKDVESVAD